MKKLNLSGIAMLLLLLCVTGWSKSKSFEIKITIPSGSTETVVYSDEEISPKDNSVTLWSKEGSSDTEVVLKPVDAAEEKVYESAYLTPGEPVKISAEKDAWFKVGVSMQNPTVEDIDVYVCVKNVEIRIE